MTEEITREMVLGPSVSRTTAERWLVILGGGAARTSSVLLPEHGIVSIGRSARNTVAIGDATVSRNHAALRMGPTIILEDLGSTNGTWVNEQRLAAHAQHELGIDEIAGVGSVRFKIEARRSSAVPTVEISPGADTAGAKQSTDRPDPPRIRRWGYPPLSEESERRQIIDALARANGHQADAAKLLGISRRTLINRLDRHKLPRPRKRRTT